MFKSLAKSQIRDGKAKSSSSPDKIHEIKRRREFGRMGRTYVCRSEHEMKRKAVLPRRDYSAVGFYFFKKI
jgi:hypothetical protein